MRRYSISIPGAPSSFPVRYDGPKGGAIWGSEVNGRHDPGAQQVEFQIEELRPNLPSQESTLTVHGVTFQQIKDSNGLIGKSIIVYGGMRPGLPLASAQAPKYGLLLEAQIIRAWGNWIGTEMSIGMTFAPGGVTSQSDQSSPTPSSGDSSSSSAPAPSGQGLTRRSRAVGFRSIDRRGFARGAIAPFGADIASSIPSFNIGDIGSLGSNVFGAATTSAGGFVNSFFGGGMNGLKAPLNLVHNMLPNTTMSSAIQQTLSTAFPKANIRVAISNALKLPYQDAGMYQNLQQYAGFLNNLSHSILGIKKYLGVQFSSKGSTLNAWDGTHPLSNVNISAFELIGQPTWININTISVKTVMRGDIECGTKITLPPTLMTLTSGAIIAGSSEQKTNTSFTGSFVVMRVLHIGDYRNPDGNGWSTNIEAVLVGETQGQTPTAQQTDNSSQDTPMPNVTIKPPPGGFPKAP